jgi:hypothetical protein
MKLILGSGVVGLLARDILGPDWTIIPFFKSRFYTFNPSLADNFIIRNDEISQYIKANIGGVKTFPYKRAYSIQGALYNKHDDGICEDWCTNAFSYDHSKHIAAYMRYGMEFDVYDIRTNQLYKDLMDKYMPEIQKGMAYGGLTAISDHKLVFGDRQIDYDKLVSTIPLDSLSHYCGFDMGLKKKDAHFIHLHTDHLDFEGNNQVLVVDKSFPFYQVTKVADKKYLFYFNESLENPGAFFMSLMKDFDIIDGTSVKDYIVLGDLPKLTLFEQMNILCVGSYAQWDWCMDVGSCILRLIKYSGRGQKEAKPNLKI